ncbi:MAG TPA: WHG domain-containing protein [Actinomycetota bacterium]|jgi:AcrR family transcriptional regulator
MSGVIDAGPRVREAVTVALDILEREGRDALTMRSLAGRMGIRAPSLYKHIRGKEELDALMIAEGFRRAGAALHEASDAAPPGSTRTALLLAVAHAYRAWALAHPHLYRLMTGGPLPRDRMPEGLEAWTAEPLVRAAGDPDLARAAFAFAHGMTILELDGRFPPGADLGGAWTAGVEALAR